MKSLCDGFVILDCENRRDSRYDLQIPTRLQYSGGKLVNREIDLVTKNISIGGAFFVAETTCPVGTCIKAVLMLPAIKLNKSSTQRQIAVRGTVIRIEKNGMAVCFDKKFTPK